MRDEPALPDRAATGGELVIAGRRIALGTRTNLALPVTESYSGRAVELPVHVWRGTQPGPTVFVAAAVHGDELNGTGVVRRLILAPPFELAAGTLVLMPVVNLLGFERHSRYLPDRRDLNRCFPGSESGSLARRYAHRVFEGVVRHCDFGIDLHTGARRRTNFPNVRGDLRHPEVRRIACAFGCELVINGKGPKGGLRREATGIGCPTVILEAGEVWKIQAGVLEVGVRGVRNVLVELSMVEGEPERPRYQARVEKTKWIRAAAGGILHFHVTPGQVVERGQPIATNTNLLGVRQNVLRSPADGVVLGMTTLPAVTPGDPVCHLAIPRGGIGPIRDARRKHPEKTLFDRIREDLASELALAPWVPMPARRRPRA